MRGRGLGPADEGAGRCREIVELDSAAHGSCEEQGGPVDEQRGQVATGKGEPGAIAGLEAGDEGRVAGNGAHATTVRRDETVEHRVELGFGRVLLALCLALADDEVVQSIGEGGRRFNSEIGALAEIGRDFVNTVAQTDEAIKVPVLKDIFLERRQGKDLSLVPEVTKSDVAVKGLVAQGRAQLFRFLLGEAWQVRPVILLIHLLRHKPVDAPGFTMQAGDGVMMVGAGDLFTRWQTRNGLGDAKDAAIFDRQG